MTEKQQHLWHRAGKGQALFLERRDGMHAGFNKLPFGEIRRYLGTIGACPYSSLLTPRHAPHSSLEGHLTFALKYEGLDLAVLKRLFAAAGPEKMADVVRTKPTGRYARRIWFLYEWLTGDRLALPNATQGAYVPAADPQKQWAVEGENSSRHRVRNNLPGTPAFCPLIFRTKRLEKFVGMNLPEKALAFGFIYIHPFEDGIGRLHRYLIHHVLARRGMPPRHGISRIRGYSGKNQRVPPHSGRLFETAFTCDPVAAHGRR